MPEDDDKKLNPGKTDYDQKFGFDASGKKSKEGSDNSESGTRSNPDTIEGVNKAEKEPTTEWKDNTSPPTEKDSQSSRFNIKNLAKKGPILSIILVIAIIALTITFALTSFLPISVASKLLMFNKYQELSTSYRVNKLVSKMITEDVTSSSCTTTKTVFCRFNGISPKMLKKLSKSGIKPIDANGKEITETGTIFKNKPKYYEFTTTSGETIKVESSNFFKTLSSNVEFSSAFRSATNSRFLTLTDAVFNTIGKRLGFTTSDKLADATSEDDINKISEDDFNEKFSDDIETGKEIAKGGVDAEEEVASIIKEEATEEANKAAKKVTSAGKTGIVQMLAAATCIVTDIPKMIVNFARSIKITQIVTYGMKFITAFNAIKAGDATAEEASAIGNTLTKTYNGKSAMDSAAMKYIMTDDTNFTEKDYEEMIPGYTVKKEFASTIKVTDSPEKKAACAVATNPVAGVAIDVAAAESGVGLPAALINAGLGLAVSELVGVLINETLPTIISATFKVIPMDKLGAVLFGDETKDASGTSSGNFIGATAAIVIGETASAGGNVPLTVDQATSYNKLVSVYENQIAQEEIATKSPFDITSENTFLGSIFSSITSTYFKSNNNSSSILTTLSMITNSITKSFGLILSPLSVSASDNDSSQFNLCPDSDINGKVAAGPFCNIIYGIPTEYLNKDSNEVINTLLADGQIDEETGDPVKDSELEHWMGVCTTASYIEAENCVISDDTKANYAIYTIDHRIVEYFNGDNE